MFGFIKRLFAGEKAEPVKQESRMLADVFDLVRSPDNLNGRYIVLDKITGNCVYLGDCWSSLPDAVVRDPNMFLALSVNGSLGQYAIRTVNFRVRNAILHVSLEYNGYLDPAKRSGVLAFGNALLRCGSSDKVVAWQLRVAVEEALRSLDLRNRLPTDGTPEDDATAPVYKLNLQELETTLNRTVKRRFARYGLALIGLSVLRVYQTPCTDLVPERVAKSAKPSDAAVPPPARKPVSVPVDLDEILQKQ